MDRVEEGCVPVPSEKLVRAVVIEDFPDLAQAGSTMIPVVCQNSAHRWPLASSLEPDEDFVNLQYKVVGMCPASRGLSAQVDKHSKWALQVREVGIMSNEKVGVPVD